jgi:hypothetical protein
MSTDSSTYSVASRLSKTATRQDDVCVVLQQWSRSMLTASQQGIPLLFLFKLGLIGIRLFDIAESERLAVLSLRT